MIQHEDKRVYYIRICIGWIFRQSFWVVVISRPGGMFSSFDLGTGFGDVDTGYLSVIGRKLF